MARTSYAKEARDLADKLRERGLKVNGDSGHHKVYRDGVLVYSFPTTPSDTRWRVNAIKDMLRLGIIEDDPYKRRNGPAASSKPKSAKPGNDHSWDYQNKVFSRVMEALTALGWQKGKKSGARTTFVKALLATYNAQNERPWSSEGVAQDALTRVLRGEKKNQATLYAMQETARKILGKQTSVKTQKRGVAVAKDPLLELLQEIGGYFNLQQQERHKVPRGAATRLGEIIIAYFEATGQKQAMRAYRGQRVPITPRIFANRLTTYLNPGQRSHRLTGDGGRMAEHAQAAWEWFLKNHDQFETRDYGKLVYVPLVEQTVDVTQTFDLSIKDEPELDLEREPDDGFGWASLSDDDPATLAATDRPMPLWRRVGVMLIVSPPYGHDRASAHEVLDLIDEVRTLESQ